MPYHVMLDTAGEAKLGKLEIGTTKRGIGPCYADKSARLGIRVQDLLDAKILRKKIMAALEPKQQLLRPFARDPKLDLHAMTEEYLRYGHRLEPHIADTARLCWDALDADRTVLFEGAQAALLDLDHGTYPFVTSSNPVAGAACVGAGVGPTDIDEVWGVCKAYTTRVGAGPFPTELDDEVGDHLRDRGHEFGTTTGRERRCGWLDLVALRYATRLNRLSALAITKLDVLSGLDPLRVAVRYRGTRGRRLRRVPLPPVDPAHRERRVRGAAGLGRGHHRRSQRGRPAARGARLPRRDLRLRRRPDQPRRRRPRPRPGDLDRRDGAQGGVMTHRDHLPQLDGDLFLTDGGIETTLIFHDGLDLPLFAAFDLLKDDEGTETLRTLLRAATSSWPREHGAGFVLESPTWRASPDWAAELGYSDERARRGSTARRSR